MTIQTVELHGERYVIMSEREFMEMRHKLAEAPSAKPDSPGSDKARFREVAPLKTSGVPVSELLIRDRR
jgi:hypothetical protein